jgi:hypothetical protein
MVVVSGRLGESLKIVYDKAELPLLETKHPLSKLILQEAHETDHSGVDRTVMWSRNVAWVVRAKRLAKTVKNNCFECKRRAKELAGQIMALLLPSRLPPAPVFHSTAVDLPVWAN